MKHRPRYWIAVLSAGIIFVAVGFFAALAPVSSDSREQIFVIPQGTWARRAAGQDIENVPSEIYLTLGVKDVFVLKNQDDVPQMFGPVLIMPGQHFELPFRVASNYVFACTLHASGQLSIVVEPTPDRWWTRLQWRVASLIRPIRLLHESTKVEAHGNV